MVSQVNRISFKVSKTDQLFEKKNFISQDKYGKVMRMGKISMATICIVKHFGFVRQDIQGVGILECVSGIHSLS